MPEDKIEHGRQDFRIDDMIPIHDEKLTPEQFAAYKTKIGIKSRQSSMLQQMVGRDVFAADEHEGMNPEMSKMMESLDAKLNYLIGINMLNEASHSEMQERLVNLSVTGVSFVSDCNYKTGDVARVTLLLPLFPPSTLELIGRVKRLEKVGDGRVRVAIRFFYRCDDEEDAVAKYVYRRHREAIRANSRNGEHST